ncbi:hypothetical protein L6452_30775 [Arctium lappa]|uniref:Uncharacterized protein n=1 Tax=Arctium lappa TaxID=4217 RepID=A0ACB8ZI81_ARCLA|nr:hypothetical protein L6452_30775 [Arctium lappa]
MERDGGCVAEDHIRFINCASADGDGGVSFADVVFDLGRIWSCGDDDVILDILVLDGWTFNAVGVVEQAKHKIGWKARDKG